MIIINPQLILIKRRRWRVYRKFKCHKNLHSDGIWVGSRKNSKKQCCFLLSRAFLLFDSNAASQPHSQKSPHYLLTLLKQLDNWIPPSQRNADHRSLLTIKNKIFPSKDSKWISSNTKPRGFGRVAVTGGLDDRREILLNKMWNQPYVLELRKKCSEC